METDSKFIYEFAGTTCNLLNIFKFIVIQNIFWKGVTIKILAQSDEKQKKAMI